MELVIRLARLPDLLRRIVRCYRPPVFMQLAQPLRPLLHVQIARLCYFPQPPDQPHLMFRPVPARKRIRGRLPQPPLHHLQKPLAPLPHLIGHALHSEQLSPVTTGLQYTECFGSYPRKNTDRGSSTRNTSIGNIPPTYSRSLAEHRKIYEKNGSEFYESAAIMGILKNSPKKSSESAVRAAESSIRERSANAEARSIVGFEGRPHRRSRALAGMGKACHAAVFRREVKPVGRAMRDVHGHGGF